MINWTETLTKKVYDIMMTGASARDAAAMLNLPSSAMIGKMHRTYGGWGTQYAKRISKTRTNPMREKEDAIIREMYPSKDFTIDDICKRLGRGAAAIQGRARYLGLTRPSRKKLNTKQEPHKWSRADDETLRILWDDPARTAWDVAKEMNLSYDAISARRKKLGFAPKVKTAIEGFKWPISKWPKNMPRFEDSDIADSVGRKIFIRTVR